MGLINHAYCNDEHECDEHSHHFSTLPFVAVRIVMTIVMTPNIVVEAERLFRYRNS